MATRVYWAYIYLYPIYTGIHTHTHTHEHLNLDWVICVGGNRYSVQEPNEKFPQECRHQR